MQQSPLPSFTLQGSYHYRAAPTRHQHPGPGERRTQTGSIPQERRATDRTVSLLTAQTCRTARWPTDTRERMGQPRNLPRSNHEHYAILTSPTARSAPRHAREAFSHSHRHCVSGKCCAAVRSIRGLCPSPRPASRPVRIAAARNHRAPCRVRSSPFPSVHGEVDNGNLVQANTFGATHWMSAFDRRQHLPDDGRPPR